MKLRRLHIHNVRSIIDADIEVHDYTMIVGANNAGKSNVLAALRLFYDDIKWSADDAPKAGQSQDDESWVELRFELSEGEWASLADKYKEGATDRLLTVRRYFVSKDRVKANQSNIYGRVKGELADEQFYGAKNVGSAKVGRVIYIPALTTASDQMKTTGPSPLRDMLNFMLKRAVSESAAYKDVAQALGALNDEAQGSDGFLNKIVQPINKAIDEWGIRFQMSITPLSPEDITKNLVKHAFADAMLGDAAFALDRYGHGFQRSFLYELIKLAPSFADGKKADKKEFDPEFTLILFEEPEAFLHPAQQENMAYHLRRLGSGEGQQVILTSHSPIFVGKGADDLCQIVRARRIEGKTVLGQLEREECASIFADGQALRACLQAFVDDSSIPDQDKKDAREMLNSADANEDIAAQEERFRYQLWLDSDRAAMFFADRVLLVEGATEKALFSWLLARDWHELTRHRIAIVDVLGKYNFHRYMALLDRFGIPYGLILDDDGDKKHHKAVNELLRHRHGPHRLAAPVFVPTHMEAFLGLNLPGRADVKPVQVMKALETGSLLPKKLNALRNKFCEALALPQGSP
ncbi:MULTISPECIES: ATP-dependent nuclease [Methylococcus]|uniref:ATP-dependent nuclease n=1 Tax=Methylococcus TaxID=413 RepID=UPI001C5278F5|nr:AAA family ATPase [Methylococcus capsulatus]QXP91854.1 AAA family ATPase [Methylococcus capsulatus]